MLHVKTRTALPADPGALRRSARRSIPVVLALLLPACTELPTAALQEAAPSANTVRATAATEVFSGSGIMTITEAPLISFKQAGGNQFFTRSMSGTFTGTMTGTFTSVMFITQHDNGIQTVHGTRIFTGTVGGRSGSCELKLSAAGVVPSTFQGRWTITSCTGDLEGLHGHGTFVPLAAFGANSYSGDFHFTG